MNLYPRAPSLNMLGPFSAVFRRPGQGIGVGGWKGPPKAAALFRGVDHRNAQSWSGAEGARVTGRFSCIAAR
jgi:hypothetical protein